MDAGGGGVELGATVCTTVVGTNWVEVMTEVM